MINNYSDYKYYIESDRISLNVPDTLFNRLANDRWKFQRRLRTLEFITNMGYPKILRLLYEFLFRRYARSLGYSIPVNVFGPGLAIPHRGTIVVNGFAKIGKNCRIHVCTNIGAQFGTACDAPVIGDNVYIGPGAKIFGKIVIGDNVVIAANAVVNKSFPQGNITLAGIPARIVSDGTSERGIIRGADLATRSDG